MSQLTEGKTTKKAKETMRCTIISTVMESEELLEEEMALPSFLNYKALNDTVAVLECIT